MKLVAIVSSGRPANVPAMEAWCAGLSPAWFVGDGEGAAYRAAGASAVTESGGLVASRNAALEAADGGWCVQLSDDLKTLQWANGKRRADTRCLTLIEALEAMEACVDSYRARLVGVAPTANPFYSSGKIKQHAFIVGDLMLIDSASRPRFDPAFSLKEDYDFTLQHLSVYGHIARVDALLAGFAHRTNAGGAVAYRDEQTERIAIERLTAKWPGAIRPNPKRPNEVLLRWPPR